MLDDEGSSNRGLVVQRPDTNVIEQIPRNEGNENKEEVEKKDDKAEDMVELTKKQLKLQENKNEVYTIKDIDELPFEMRHKFDKRNIFQFFWDRIKCDNMFLHIFFRNSLLIPYYIRIFNTFAIVSLMLTLNAILYQDSDIKQRFKMDTNPDVS